ncbi:MAG: metallophosphatase [Enterococcus sp.]
MKYFTADTHYFHQELLKKNDFAPRFFDSIDEMHQVMIENWNAVIHDYDTVYNLGDVAIHPRYEDGFGEIYQLLCQLNGQIIFIKGNHDTRALFKYLEKHNLTLPNGKKKFDFADVGVLLKFNHHQYYLTHYPLLLGPTKNSRNLHGHIHHSSIPFKENLNVGVDAPEMEFFKVKLPFGTPVSEDQIEELFDQKAYELHKLRNSY